MAAFSSFLSVKPSKLLFFIFCFFVSTAFSQENNYIKKDIQECTLERIVDDNALNQISVEYQFNGFFVNEINYEGNNYQTLSIKDFGFSEEVGKAMLAVRYDNIAIPNNAEVSLVIEESSYIEFSPFTIFPAFEPLSDSKNEQLRFEKDEVYYAQNSFLPEQIVQIESIQQMAAVHFARIRISPFTYNPVEKKIRFYTKIKYRLSFSKDFSSYSSTNDVFIPILKRSFLNPNQIHFEAKNPIYGYDSLDYLIITTDKYLLAADSLSRWRNQMGYSTKIVSKNTWISQEVKDSIHHYYNKYTTPPDYFVIMGDHEDVPAEDMDSTGNFVSDLYYACMNGPGDFFPDIARGRISVSTIEEALTVVDKTISYEKNPPFNTGFYNSALHCAEFQDDEPNGYATRRFTHTSEEARDYLITKGYKVNRVYATHPSVNPQYYNNGYYSNGQAIPPSLLRANGFQWDGNYQDILDSINDGRFLVLHRDHGYNRGWGTPHFRTWHLDFLHNADLYPLVLSINCSSGQFNYPLSFAEKFLRLKNKGAIGVIAASAVSYSGYNDALAIGFYDAIWSNPGISPAFGSAGNPNPLPTPHNDIYDGGSILNHALIRMSETFNILERQYQLFHYHGDPALKIWTEFPQQITANVQDTLICGDSTLQIYSSSCPDAIATLCLNGKMIGKTSLIAGVGTISFPPIANISATTSLTISKEKHRVFIQEIPIVNCTNPPLVAYTSDKELINPCENIVRFFDQSTYVPTQWKWEIQPSSYQFIQNTTDTSQYPVVAFDTVGYYTIKLIVENTYGIDSISYVDYIYLAPSINIGYVQDFEACSPYPSLDCLLSNGWEVSDEYYNWRLYKDSTPSYNTGPILDHTLGTNQGIYFYTEASSGSHLDTARFIIPCVDISSAQNPVLSFWYHMYGAYIHKLYIDIYHNGMWYNAVHTISFQQQTSYDDPWKEALVDLSAFASASGIKIRFTAVKGNDYRGDIAIDDINIIDYLDIPNPAFTVKDDHSCCGFQLEFSDSSCCGVNSWQWYFTGANPSSSNLQNPVVTYQNPGSYDVKLITTNANGTDSVSKTAVVHIGQDYSSPNFEDFEAFTTGNPGIFINGWETHQSHDFNWRVNSGGTPSLNTGPLHDHTLANASGKYVYTESSHVNINEEATLYSPCFTIDTSAQDLSLSFWYHIYGNYIDTLYLEINKGDSWDLVYFLEGSQQLNQNDPWRLAAVDISSYIAPRLRYRFRSIRGISYMEDIAVDDINIDTVPAFRCATTEHNIIFDSLAINDMQILSFYIQNTGVGILQIDTILLQSPFHILTATNFDVLPGDSQLVFVQFYPQNDGVYQDTVVLVSSQSICDVVVSGVCDNRLDIQENDNYTIVYPNPARNQFFIQMNSIAAIDIFDVNASLVYHNEGQKSYTINALTWMSGVYHIRISTADKLIYRRLVIMH